MDSKPLHTVTRRGRIPASRQLREPESGIVQRLFRETKALSEHTIALVEMHIKKAQLELEERLDARVNALISQAAFVLLAGLGILFLLSALSLAIGVWLGHAGWGFLVVGSVLLIGGFIILRKRPHLLQIGSGQIAVDEERLASQTPHGPVVGTEA